MKSKILAELMKKFSGLSKEFLGLLADKLAAKVTEESQIEGALAELDNSPIPVTDLASEFQKEGDRRVSEAKKKWGNPNPQNPQKPNNETANDPADEAPAWFKLHQQQVNAELEKLRTQNLQGSMESRRSKDLKDIPAKFWAKIPLPQKEEEYEAYIEGIKTDYNEFRDEQVSAGLMTATKPENGIPGSAASAKVIDADIAAWAKDKALNTATQKTT